MLFQANTGIMEDLYMWKDVLLVLFNLIDYNHSGNVCLILVFIYNIYKIGFISRNEFADVIKLMLHGEDGTGDVSDAYIDELSAAMDFDKNGKIDINEFLGKISVRSSYTVDYARFNHDLVS